MSDLSTSLFINMQFYPNRKKVLEISTFLYYNIYVLLGVICFAPLFMPKRSLCLTLFGFPFFEFFGFPLLNFQTLTLLFFDFHFLNFDA